MRIPEAKGDVESEGKSDRRYDTGNSKMRAGGTGCEMSA
jgi:hypothetical protein